MVLYTCEKCNKEFNRKSNYENHLKRKNSCVKKVDKDVLKTETIQKNPKKSEIIQNNPLLKQNRMECPYCSKFFSTMSNLNKHIKNSCKIKKQEENKKEKIFKSLLEKNDLLIKQNELLSQKLSQQSKEDKESTKIIKKLSQRISKLEKSSLVSINSNNITNNTTNNTTNIKNNNINIQVVQFGKEDLTKIDKKHYLKIFNDSRSSGYKFFTDVIKSIHFNPNYPEYHSIYISDINRNKCMIFDGNNWKLYYLDKDNNIISEIIEKTITYSNENNELIEQKYKNNESVKHRINIITKTLNKCDNDYIQDLIDEDEENPNNKTKENIKKCSDFKELVEEKVKLLLYNEKNNIVK